MDNLYNRANSAGNGPVLGMSREPSMSKKLPCFTEKNGSFYYTPTMRGKTKWIPLGKEKSIALMRYHQLRDNTISGVTINELLDNYIRSEEFTTKKLSKYTIDTYEHGMEQVRKAMGHLDASELEATTISRFIHAAPGSSGNSWVSPLSQAYKRGILDGLVQSTPFRKGDIQYRPVAVRVRVVGYDEIMMVREHGCDQVKLFIDICTRTGLRVSDVLALGPENFTDEGLRVEIQKKRRNHQVLLFKWTDDLRQACDRLPFKKGLSTTAISKRFHRSADRAGVENLTCHDVRRWVLQESKRAGLNAQGIAGHSNARQTASYTLGIPDVVAPLTIQDSTSAPDPEPINDQPRLRLVR